MSMNRLLLLTIAAAWQVAMAGEPARQTLAYAPAPVNNPLKGLVPYATLPDLRRDSFPHSMEFNYIPLSALVTGYDQYDWAPLEKLLAGAASRGHQAIFRVYQEWPGQKDLIPAFLIRDGLKIHKYLNTNTQPFPPAEVETPDYADANLRKVMRQFIAALGKKYDGDPRIGFITAGLLGTWGEWHDWPRTELFAGKEVQAEVMAAYETAFHVTPVLLRCPAGEMHGAIAANAQRPFGYHDDSFAWSTLDTGRKEDAHFFLAAMRVAGPAAFNKWKTRPIGGEIRPEAWGKVFDPDPGVPEIQNFRKCVEATHVSWLMDSGLFQQERDAGRIRRAEKDVRRMGYEFHVPAVTIRPPASGMLAVRVEIENRGVAPFYYDWPVEFGLLDAGGNVVKTFPGSGKITGLLPGDAPRRWDENLDLEGVKPGTYILALRIPNPLPKGMPIRFANQTQDQHAPGWLTLGSCTQNVARAGTAEEQPVSGSFNAKGGVKIHYLVQGTGEPVVLIHGYQASIKVLWDLPGTIALLAKKHQVIALDLPGHGESDKPITEDAYGAQMSEDVLELMAHLKIEKAHIVGYSMGGLITLKFIADHPERALSGTLGGSGWVSDTNAFYRAAEELEKNEHLTLIKEGPCYRSIGKLAIPRAALQAIRTPVAILIGDQDSLYHVFVTPLASVRPDWPVTKIQAANHCDCFTRPQFREALSHWLDTTTGRVTQE